MLTAFGVLAAATMVTAYGLEPRGSAWVAVFAAGCVGTAVYGLLIGAWIFAVLESIWAAIAFFRFRVRRAAATDQ
jgi:hypothetical protein